MNEVQIIMLICVLFVCGLMWLLIRATVKKHEKDKEAKKKGARKKYNYDRKKQDTK